MDAPDGEQAFIADTTQLTPDRRYIEHFCGEKLFYLYVEKTIIALSTTKTETSELAC